MMLRLTHICRLFAAPLNQSDRTSLIVFGVILGVFAVLTLMTSGDRMGGAALQKLFHVIKLLLLVAAAYFAYQWFYK